MAQLMSGIVGTQRELAADLKALKSQVDRLARQQSLQAWL
jgi:hypothetical protein